MDLGQLRSRARAARKVLGELTYGMLVYEFELYAMRSRAQLENVFLLVTFGDLLGIPVLPPYYTLRLLPHAVPAFSPWKRRLLRERDFFGMLGH